MSNEFTEDFWDCLKSVVNKPKEVLSYSFKPLRGQERFDWKRAAMGGFIGSGMAINMVAIPMLFASSLIAENFFQGFDREKAILMGAILGLGITALAGYHVGVFAGYRYARVRN